MPALASTATLPERLKIAPNKTLANVRFGEYRHKVFLDDGIMDSPLVIPTRL